MEQNRTPDNINPQDEFIYSANGNIQTHMGNVSQTHSPKLRKRAKRSLFMEYVNHWYIIVISGLMFVPAFLLETFMFGYFVSKNIPSFVSALLTMFVGGLVATLPFFILNIVLVKRKKFYAIVVQIVAMMFLGMVFYLRSRIML